MKSKIFWPSSNYFDRLDHALFPSCSLNNGIVTYWTNFDIWGQLMNNLG